MRTFTRHYLPRNSRFLFRWPLVCGLFSLGLAFPSAQAEEPPRRARPPKWTQEETEVFFQDAREHLVGPRPTPSLSSTAQEAASGDKEPSKTPQASIARWSSIIDAETLQAEVKRLHINLNTNLARPAKFKGGGNLQCQRDFSVLAVVFEIIHDFDKDIRWKSSALGMAVQSLRASEACSTGTDDSYATAQEVHARLTDLLRGQRPSFSASDGSDGNRTPGFPQLMQRMEQALTEKISPSLSNARSFRKAKLVVSQEAQVLAVLAEVICQQRFDYGDDETYLEYSRTLRDSCESLGRAARDGNYEAARKATGTITKSCSECHEGYRG